MKRKNFFNRVAFSVSILLLTSMGLNIHTLRAQTDSPLKLVCGQPVSDIVGVDSLTLPGAALSPDGKTIATFSHSGLCLHQLDPRTTNCVKPDNTPVGRADLYWSPDGNYIAFTEDVTRFYQDGDIWVYDVAARTLTDRTDDDFAGSYNNLPNRPSAKPIFLDYIPGWDPSTGGIYFFRNEARPPANSGGYTEILPPALYTLKLNSSGPILVRSLPTHFRGVYPVRAVEISTDGKQMLVLLLDRDHWEDSQNGIWLLDLKSKDSRQIVSSAKGFAAGLPDGENPLDFISRLFWTKDGGILFMAEGSTNIGPFHANAYYLNMISQTLLPIFDFSWVKSEEQVNQPGPDGISPATLALYTGVYLPEYDVLLTLNGPTESGIGVYIVSMAKAAQGSIGKPVLIGTFAAESPKGAGTCSYNNDNPRVLVDGYLLTLETQ